MQVSLSDHDTLVTVTGSDRGNPPTLLIHALGLDRNMWSQLASLLADEQMLVSYDLRGHGFAAGAPIPFSLQRLADDAADLLEVLRVQSARVVGLSLGGAVAQVLALRRPRLVAGLSLCSTLCRGKSVSRERADQAEREGIAPQIEPTLTRWFTPEAAIRCPEAVEYARARITAMRVADWAAAWRALAELDTLERLPGLTVPTQVIVGDHDVSTPIAESELIAGLVPGAKLHVIPGGSHMLSLEHPKELAACVAAEP